MLAEAVGTHERNSVWRTEESLWQDVAVKSPKNPRGQLNCGASFVASGKHGTALPYLERARAMDPENYSVYINLGIAYGGLGRDAEAAQSFERASALAPSSVGAHLYYALWLKSKHRMEEAQAQLEAVLQLDPLVLPARHWLMQIYDGQKNAVALDRMAYETLRLNPNDDVAKGYLAGHSNTAPANVAAAAPASTSAAPEAESAETILHDSLAFCRAGKYEECIAGARKAIAVKPDYAEAYNNLAAAYIALRRWDEGIRAASEAVRLKPDFEMARKNLERARALKQRGGG
jgi:tetratricopeptide (TPR) repeat protein